MGREDDHWRETVNEAISGIIDTLKNSATLANSLCEKSSDNEQQICDLLQDRVDIVTRISALEIVLANTVRLLSDINPNMISLVIANSINSVEERMSDSETIARLTAAIEVIGDCALESAQTRDD